MTGDESERIEPSPAASARAMIVAEDAHVTYRVYASGKRLSARDSVFSVNALRGGRGLHSVHALRGVSFTASEGETIGVVGHNGSGKSTLFRAMTGLIPPSQGAIWAAERPVLLGVNAALVPDLSGENNIKLGLLAMGFSTEEAAASVDEIADFAELNEFLYHPMRTYSSGMAARLRFAIASAKPHSILLIDEALSVGDRRFRTKSEERIRALRDSAGLVMIVSHSVGSLRDTCDRVMWIHKGELVADGPTDAVIDDYIAWTKKPGGAVGAASVVKSRGASAGAAARATAATATVAAGSTAPLPVPPEKEETALRRGRFRRSVEAGYRRRVLAVAATAGAVLIALGAVAAIAAPRTSEVPDVRVTPGAAGDAPTIERFTSGAASAVCITPEGETQVPLNWKIDGASRIAIASAPKEVDAFKKPLHDDLPAEASTFLVSYPCEQASRAYTLMAESADGGRVSTVVIVSRTIARTPKPTPTPTEAPRRNTGGGQSGNGGGNPGGSVGTDTGGGGVVVDPGPVPVVTPPPVPEPTAEPTPEPTPEPTSPSQTPPPDPVDPSATPAPPAAP
ncbi:ABC transporter ATP-binding protein [Microbacterium sp. RD1]|uniref:ABC transporter ATP-binding protein n=1 Tax=Microbacterium sp. RD1 TaxID=3457313 RepID=UPI003FA570D3